MTIANVGSNAVNISNTNELSDITPILPSPGYLAPKCSSPRLIHCPDVETDPAFQVLFNKRFSIL